MVVMISYLEPGLGKDEVGGKIFESKEDILYLSNGKTGSHMVSKSPPSSLHYGLSEATFLLQG